MNCYPTTTDWTCVAETFVDELPDAIKARAEMLAWAALQSLAGFNMSPCPVELRPCRQRCNPGVWEAYPVSGGTFAPFVNGLGQWVNTCGCGGDTCSCGPLHEIALPSWGDVTAVEIDGTAVPFADWRVDNHRMLVRMDGEAWPACQDLGAPAGEVGTFVITFYPGGAPDALANIAAGKLAEQFALACQGKKCKLPANVTAVTRAGVTMEMQPGLFPENATGIPEVDLWVRSVNPHSLRTPTRIASPDYRPGRITTGSR